MTSMVGKWQQKMGAGSSANRKLEAGEGKVAAAAVLE